MVKRIQEQTHKHSGVGSSISNNQTFLSYLEKQTSVNSDRQHNSSTVHQQARGNTVNGTLYSDVEVVEFCSSESNGSESSPHRRNQQLPSGQPKQNTSEIDRMVSEYDSSGNDFQVLGSTKYRYVCNQAESENNSVLLMENRSSGICSGCAIDFLGKSSNLCVSTTVTYSQTTTSHAELSLSGNTDSAFLAETNMVSSTATAVSSSSFQITNPKKLTNSRSGQKDSRTSKSRNVQSDCMEIIDKQLKTKGFSKQSRELLSASWRSGTQKDYKAKFRQFNSWCDQRKIDPYQASLKDCANFLASLYEKGLKYRTIAGYRSMLSSVLPNIDKTPVGQHPYIIRLLKGVFNSRPPERKLLPEWDLPLVLEMFKKPPFVPTKYARLKYITWKTVFLVAITTFRRCSDLQALRIGEGSVNIQEKGITFLRHGLAKQDRAGHDNSKILVPAFSESKLLDPKRAVYEYLKRTQEFREKEDKSESKLFLAINKPHLPVTSQTISSWIVKTIKFAYSQQKKSIGKV